MQTCEAHVKLAPQHRWLPDMDSNHDKQIQSLLCYRYTIRQIGEVTLQPLTLESSAQKGSHAL